MKAIKLCFIIIFLILIQDNYCEAITIIKFEAKDVSNNTFIKPDSIIVTNITQNLKKTITTDSIDLDLIFTSVIGDQGARNHLFISSNSPNPFENSTIFKLYKATHSEVSLSVYDFIGNLILNDKMFLEVGIHDFSLNLESANPGIYFLSVIDGNEQYTLKLIKTGNISSNTSSITYYGSDPSKIVYNGKEKGNILLTLNDNFYSFECFVSGYQIVSIYNNNNGELFSNNKLTFFLQPQKKYNINFGNIDIGGIYFKHQLRKQEQAASGGGFDTTIVFDSIYNFQHILENRYLPNDDGWYHGVNGRFLSCLNFIEDSLITDFCYKTFSMNIYNDLGTYLSSTILVRIKFNKYSQSIDSMNIWFSERDWYVNQAMDSYSSFEDINTQINLFNLPFTIDVQNNINIDIKGMVISDFLRLNYSRNMNYHQGASMVGSEEESILGIDSVSSDSYLKLMLNQK